MTQIPLQQNYGATHRISKSPHWNVFKQFSFCGFWFNFCGSNVLKKVERKFILFSHGFKWNEWMKRKRWNIQSHFKMNYYCHLFHKLLFIRMIVKNNKIIIIIIDGFIQSYLFFIFLFFFGKMYFFYIPLEDVLRECHLLGANS